MSVRLNKLLAERGLGARRACDALVQSGVVRVNGQVVREPGTQIELGRDKVTVSGRALPGRAAPAYYVLNKPVGFITTLKDPQGRRTIRDLMPSGPRLFPVGRLDADTSGLLVLTNDGELAHRLMHPRYGVEKLYRVSVDRAPAPEAVARLRSGVAIGPGERTAPAKVRVVDREGRRAVLSIAIHEGRYRQVRRMCEAVGLRVVALHRYGYGPLRLGPVSRGLCRELSLEEVRRLKAASARPHPRSLPKGELARSRARGRAQLERREEPARRRTARRRRSQATGQSASRQSRR